MVDFLTQHGIASWNGYRYWMGITPYPNGVDTWENPSILASNDKDTWVVPDGLTNPIWAPDAGFAPDPDLVYDPATGRLYCFWAGVRFAYSTDGVTWSAAVNPFSASGEVSPAVILDGGVWKMWSVNTTPNPNQVLYREAAAPEGLWTVPEVVDMPPWNGRDIWHLDVQKVGGTYYALVADCVRDVSGADARLLMGLSDDGHSWELGAAEVIPRVSGSFADTHIYRSTMVPIYSGDTLTGFDVWYSGRSAAGAWRTGRTIVEHRSA